MEGGRCNSSGASNKNVPLIEKYEMEITQTKA